MPPLSAGRAEVSVSDPGELRPLRKHLRRVPGLEVEETGTAGETGAGADRPADALRVLAGGRGALGRAVRTLPAFLRTRRGAVTVTVRARDWTVTLHPDDPTADGPTTAGPTTAGPTVTELAAALRALRDARA